MSGEGELVLGSGQHAAFVSDPPTTRTNVVRGSWYMVELSTPSTLIMDKLYLVLVCCGSCLR